MASPEPRKICVVTSSRAEYGHMRWLCHDIAAAPDLALQMVVTGAHLSARHGLTYRAIEADGLHIDARVDSLMDGDGPVATTKSLGLCMIGMGEVFERLCPDIVLILGDRYEMLGVAAAAMIARLVIAHLHGGEVSEGAMDESVRHSLTKMAHLHFCAAEPYRRRILQLGEDPARVFDVGAPGLDHLTRTPMLARAELAASLGLPLRDPVLLVTYHPVTRGGGDPAAAIEALLGALDAIPEATVVFTGVNVDPGHAVIAERVGAWTAANRHRAALFASLGQQRYLSLMREAAAVVGNSSSGLIEAPAVGVPTVNIGPRQDGRLRAASVIDCGEDRVAITEALARALGAEERARARRVESLYGRGDAGRRIVELLRQVDIKEIQMKRFHDRNRDR